MRLHRQGAFETLRMNASSSGSRLECRRCLSLSLSPGARKADSCAARSSNLRTSSWGRSLVARARALQHRVRASSQIPAVTDQAKPHELVAAQHRWHDCSRGEAAAGGVDDVAVRARLGSRGRRHTRGRRYKYVQQLQSAAFASNPAETPINNAVPLHGFASVGAALYPFGVATGYLRHEVAPVGGAAGALKVVVGVLVLPAAVEEAVFRAALLPHPAREWGRR
eukprot:364840-Chlamydomonas_euryale.AAC.8